MPSSIIVFLGADKDFMRILAGFTSCAIIGKIMRNICIHKVDRTNCVSRKTPDSVSITRTKEIHAYIFKNNVDNATENVASDDPETNIGSWARGLHDDPT